MLVVSRALKKKKKKLARDFLSTHIQDHNYQLSCYMSLIKILLTKNFCRMGWKTLYFISQETTAENKFKGTF